MLAFDKNWARKCSCYISSPQSGLFLVVLFQCLWYDTKMANFLSGWALDALVHMGGKRVAAVEHLPPPSQKSATTYLGPRFYCIFVNRFWHNRCYNRQSPFAEGKRGGRDVGLPIYLVIIDDAFINKKRRVCVKHWLSTISCSLLQIHVLQTVCQKWA